MLQQPSAIDRLLHQVERQVEVLARGFKTDARVLLREREEFAGKRDCGFETATDLAMNASALFGREVAGLRGQGVTGDDESRLVGDGLKIDGGHAGESQVGLGFATAFQFRQTNSCTRSGKWRLAIATLASPCGSTAIPAGGSSARQQAATHATPTPSHFVCAAANASTACNRAAMMGAKLRFM